MSKYYYSRTIEGRLDEVEQRVTAALKEEGFGVLTEIDVGATLKKKLEVDFRHYKILGACNPKMAHQALQTEDKIGVMLPCNVILQDAGQSKVEVAAVDPEASMLAVGNPALSDIAAEVGRRLRKVVESA